MDKLYKIILKYILDNKIYDDDTAIICRGICKEVAIAFKDSEETDFEIFIRKYYV